MRATKRYATSLQKALARDYTPEKVRALVQAGYGHREQIVEKDAQIAGLRRRIDALEAELAGGVETAEEAEREAREFVEWGS